VRRHRPAIREQRGRLPNARSVSWAWHSLGTAWKFGRRSVWRARMALADVSGRRWAPSTHKSGGGTARLVGGQRPTDMVCRGARLPSMKAHYMQAPEEQQVPVERADRRPRTTWGKARLESSRARVVHDGLENRMSDNDTLAERLRRRPAKPMGSPRVGSNPTGVDYLAIYSVACLQTIAPPISCAPDASFSSKPSRGKTLPQLFGIVATVCRLT
jgi:hypothetical protein